jgi:hypothetical protein
MLRCTTQSMTFQSNPHVPHVHSQSTNLVYVSLLLTLTIIHRDFSNYWTAVLYFRARNGTFKRVPQITSEGLGGRGGITVYYIPAMNNRTGVTAFKPGFRMLVGDANLKSPGTAHKVCHRCMPKSGDNSNINCGAPDDQTLPTGFCVGGIRSVITFPTCWDGKNLDSPNHQSHVAYGIGSKTNDVGPTGDCPSTHPVILPQVMYEVMWDVSIHFIICINFHFHGLLMNFIADRVCFVDSRFQRQELVAGGWLATLRVEYWRHVSLSPPEHNTHSKGMTDTDVQERLLAAW